MCTREQWLHLDAVRLEDGQLSQNGLEGNVLEPYAHLACPER